MSLSLLNNEHLRTIFLRFVHFGTIQGWLNSLNKVTLQWNPDFVWLFLFLTSLILIYLIQVIY